MDNGKLYNLIHGQGQGHGASEVQKIAKNCTFLGLSPLPFTVAAGK